MTEGRHEPLEAVTDPAPVFVVGRSPRSWQYRWPLLQRLYWDVHSRWWDGVENRYGQEEDLAVVEWLERARGRGTLRVLDIGCGTGTHAEMLAARGFDVVGIDISPGMLERARAKTRIPMTGTVVFQRASLNDPLPLDDASFDAALCLAVMSTVTDVPRFLGEVHRVLRPGGLFVVRVIRFMPATRFRGTMSGFLFSLGRAVPAWTRRVRVRTRGDLLRLLSDAQFRLSEERPAQEMLTAAWRRV
jgi:SAM-dependent methyltransferase